MSDKTCYCMAHVTNYLDRFEEINETKSVPMTKWLFLNWKTDIENSNKS